LNAASKGNDAKPLTTAKKSLSRLKVFFKEQHILMTLLKEFRDGILICDHQGQILQLNDSLKSFLQLDDRVVGRQVTDVIRDEHFQGLLTSVLKAGGSEVEEVTLESTAREMFFEIHLVPILLTANAVAKAHNNDHSGHADEGRLDGDRPGRHKSDRGAEPTEPAGEPDGIVIIFHDITDIRRTEKMRRDFVANVSHELRTPLSAIEGYAETLLEGALEDQAVCRDFIQVIHRHSLRLTQLVHDLLDLSKLESPDYKPEFLPISLWSLIQQAFVLVEDKALEKQIEISVDIQEPLPRVMAESSSMQQVITNLLDNAIKYTPTQGQVHVSAFLNTKGAREKVQVDVRDNGLGIEAKYLPRIFERFYRVDKARSRDLGGTGLGLSIVKHIVQLHGGEIWVDSIVNQGSTFSFTLDSELRDSEPRDSEIHDPDTKSG
jgi:two-component system phosphate regulon sensor histidine kinase PhoR